MSEPSEKIILVTGGSGGLGRSLARAFARQGCGVVIAGRSGGKLHAAAEEIGKHASRYSLYPATLDKKIGSNCWCRSFVPEWDRCRV